MTSELKTSTDPDLRVQFDIHDSTLADSVYDRYAELRSTCPIAYSESYGGHWVVTKYEAVQSICRNPAIFSNSSVTLPATVGQEGSLIPIEIDPPEHTIYRKLITPLFSPKRMAALEPEIRKIVVELLDAMVDERKVDFVSAFAKPLPTRVFLALMGWPQEDASKFNEWSDTLVLGEPGASEEESTAKRTATAMEVYAYFSKVYQERLANPAHSEDITQILIGSNYEDRPLSEFEVLNIIFTMLIAGLHTVQGQLAHSIIYFAQNPEQRQTLVRDPAMVNSAVEEMLRWESAVAPTRIVKEDVVVDGVQFRKGDTVLISFGSADRDEDKFEDADKVDIARNPNPHIAFGSGNHRCVGSHLARIQLQVAFEEIHRRIADYRLDPNDPPRRHLSHVKGVERLPLILSESL